MIDVVHRHFGTHFLDVALLVLLGIFMSLLIFTIKSDGFQNKIVYFVVSIILNGRKTC